MTTSSRATEKHSVHVDCYPNTAYSVVFRGDEDGWHMIVEADDGRHDFRVHGVAWDLAAHAAETLGEWRAEGEAARGTRVFVTESDLEGYAPDDPKRVELNRVIDAGGYA